MSIFSSRRVKPSGVGAFTLVETMVAIAVVSILAMSLVGMMVMSGKLTRAAREQLTAAEILEAKIDALRSSSWSQLKQTTFIEPVFAVTNGISYWGTISNAMPTGTESYISNLMEFSITVYWQAEGRPRSLTANTLISSDGLSAQ